MHVTALPDWLIRKASVEKARHGHIGRRTARLIRNRVETERERQASRHAPPIAQNLGQLIEARLKLAKVRLPAVSPSNRPNRRPAVIIPFPAILRRAAA